MKKSYLLTGIFSILIFGLAVNGTCFADKDERGKNKVKGELSVMVLGSGGPVATAEGRASAGYLVFTDEVPRVLMDVGGGTFQRLAQSGINIKDLDIVLLSHLHIDHTGDLSSVIKTIYFHNNQAGTGRTDPVRIYGPETTGAPFEGTDIPQYPHTTEYADHHYSLPEGTERYLNAFAGAISQGASSFAYEAYDLPAFVSGTEMHEVLSTDDGLVIKSIAVDHGPVPAVAFRIEYKGHSIAYSGDTASTGPNMETIADGVDLLIYDTAILDDAPDNPVFHVLHTSPTRMAEVANATQPGTLVLSHITPVTSESLDLVKDIVRDGGYQGKIKSAKDLTVYNLGKKHHHDDDD